MSKLTHYMIHCTATPEGMEVTGDKLRQWHIGPARTAEGKLKYKGKIYDDVFALPDDKIGGIHINQLVGGRGWRQVGYADLIRLDDKIENLVPYDEDDNVDSLELTNGILASSELYSGTRHIVYAGGMDTAFKKPKDTRTTSQITHMTMKVFETISYHPDIVILGHNQVDPRACPSFNVPDWLTSIGVADKNISKLPLKYQL